MQDNFDKEFRQREIDTLKYVIDFLEKNDIMYYGCFGTAIGAIRHKGLIPWDDDIDLVVPRKDYNRLLSLKKEFIGTGYDVVSFETDPGYYFPFAKIISTQMTLWEHKEHPFIIGSYVDIFPLESTDMSDEEFYEMHRIEGPIKYKYIRSIERYDFKDYITLLRKRDFIHIFSRLRSAIFYRSTEKYAKEYSAFLNSIDNPNGKKYVCFLGDKYGSRLIMKKEWFTDRVEVPFEDFSIKLPVGYDQLLRHIYGDYMKCPDVSQRISDHVKYFADMEKRLSLREAKRKVKQTEKKR